MEQTEEADKVALQNKEMLTRIEQANHETERAFWWMKGIDREMANRIGVSEKICNVLKLLQTVDDITMDIIIKIKQK